MTSKQQPAGNNKYTDVTILRTVFKEGYDRNKTEK